MKEVLYIVYLLSGILKTFLMYFNIPVPFDITLIMALILTAVLIRDLPLNDYTYTITNSSKLGLLLLSTLFVLIIISFFYSSSQLYILEKTMRFLTIYLAFIFPLLNKGFSVDKFIKWFIVIVSILSLIYLPIFLQSFSQLKASYSEFSNDPISSMYGSYLIVGYTIGVALILNLFSNHFTPTYRLMIFGILFITLLITGARGPLLSFMFVLFLFLLRPNQKFKKIKFKNLLIFSVLILVILSYGINKINIYDTLDRTYQRIVSLESISKDSSANNRLLQAKFVINKLDATTTFQGYGFGSYGIEYIGADTRYYPHNIVLEILFELGVIGLFLYLLLLFIIFRKIYLNPSFLLFSLLIYLFLNSLKSLSLVDSRLMFGMFAIILLYNLEEKIKKEN